MKKHLLSLNRTIALSALIAAGVALPQIHCGAPDFSPWMEVVPEEMQNINQKSLQAIAQRKTPGDSFKVALTSDPQRNPYAFRTLVERINDRADLDEFAFLFILGDITDTGLLAEYEAIWDTIRMSKLPVVGVIGNHDSISEGKEIYKQMFGIFDFSFDYKNTRFIVFNNNGFEFENVPNYSFLESAAAGHESRHHTVGVAHVPFDSSGYLLNGRDPWQFFVQNHIFHGIFGHRHDFYFTQDQGLTSFVVDKVTDQRLHSGVIHVTPTQIYYDKCLNDGCYPLNY